MDMTSSPRISFSAQGFYYLVAGLWPLFGMRIFMVLTGPKTDLWIVKTLGLLLSVIGVFLIGAGVRCKHSRELMMLAIGSVGVLAGVDISYAAKEVTSGVYLLYSFLEIVIIILLLILLNSMIARAVIVDGVTESHLADGLKVVLLENHKAPVATFQVWYRAGSRNDPWGKSGLAHVFEHLMFKGTPKVGRDDFTRIIKNIKRVDIGNRRALIADKIRVNDQTIPIDWSSSEASASKPGKSGKTEGGDQQQSRSQGHGNSQQ